jgi:hypothetical protein
VRRRRLPLEQKSPELQGRASPDEKQGDMSAASGKSAGSPLYLNQALTATLDPAITPELDDEFASTAEDAPEEQAAARMTQAGGETAGDLQPDVAPLPEVSGTGIETELSAYSLTLRGRTDATFSSSFRTRNVRTSAATGCDCADSECVHVTGTLESTFRVTTTVTLPGVSDFPDLTPCQRERVRDGITNVLAPHEQQHVAAFRTYNGTVATPFDLTICRSELDARIQDLHDSIDGPRQSAARAASDALDPFQFDVDLDCQD